MHLHTEITDNGIQVSDNTGHILGLIKRNVDGDYWYLDEDLEQRIEGCGWPVARNEFQSLQGIKYYILAMEYEAQATGH